MKWTTCQYITALRWTVLSCCVRHHGSVRSPCFKGRNLEVLRNETKSGQNIRQWPSIDVGGQEGGLWKNWQKPFFSFILHSTFLSSGALGGCPWRLGLRKKPLVLYQFFTGNLPVIYHGWWGQDFWVVIYQNAWITWAKNFGALHSISY